MISLGSKEDTDNAVAAAKIAFERKNHDFGTRELCRLGLDIFIAINSRQLTSEEINIANKHLKEDVSIQTVSYTHLRAHET